MSMRNEKVIVIGGSGGLGRALCEKLNADYEIFALGSRDLDLTNREQVQKFFIEHDAEVIINLAGYNFDCLLHRYDTSTYIEMDKQIDVVVKGSVNLLNACLPGMRSRGYGRIIFFSSILAAKPVIGTGVYAASKAFIEGLVKACAVENASKGVTANAIQIGYFDGGLTHQIPRPLQSSILAGIPSGRFGSIDELENIIRFIINTEYINGSTLKVNGGAQF
jgi:NAD(P)-dependent dehydrogenase (short-subunit alcohol dehydrogenase family)